MLVDNKIWMAQGDNPCYLLLNQANRHGLIAGASGTGKTVTLKLMAEGFSQAGVPVFMADVKGDVTGMAQAGDDTENIQKRVEKFGIENWSLRGCPVRIWDMMGDRGLPVRVTVSEMGPTLLSRLLGLTDVQEGVLNIVFRVADDNGLLLDDLKDLRAMLNYVEAHADEYNMTYGKVSGPSISAILRALIALEDQGADQFFGMPSIDLNDWFACTPTGEGYVNILNAAKLINSPQVYAMFLLWMLGELFEDLPEEGDVDKPKFVFFFDEAHLLFNNMPRELLDKIVQVVKLIRSKGVGVYFITQSPSDIPDEVLAQLSNRIQHGLRAYTPAEMKAVKTAAQAFRENPNFKSEEVILELGTGEALVSFLDEEGRPSIVENAKILCPQCLMAAASEDTMMRVLNDQQGLMAKYGLADDRESAFEMIRDEAARVAEEDALAAERRKFEEEKAAWEKQKAEEQAAAEKQAQKDAEKAEKEAQKAAEKAEREAERAAEKAEREAERAAEKAEREAEKKAAAEEKARQKKQDQVTKAATSIATSMGREAGVRLVRNILGGLLK